MSKTHRTKQQEQRPWKELLGDTKRYLLRKQEEHDVAKELKEAKEKTNYHDRS